MLSHQNDCGIFGQHAVLPELLSQLLLVPNVALLSVFILLEKLDVNNELRSACQLLFDMCNICQYIRNMHFISVLPRLF